MQRELSKLFFISFFLGAKNPVRPLDKKKKFQLPKTSEVSNMQHEYQNQWGSCAIKRVYIKKKKYWWGRRYESGYYYVYAWKECLGLYLYLYFVETSAANQCPTNGTMRAACQGQTKKNEYYICICIYPSE